MVQGKDDEHYLHYIFGGKVNKAGSIFLDYRNLADFTDTPDAPKTGDTTNLWIPVTILMAAFAGIIVVTIRIRRKKF